MNKAQMIKKVAHESGLTHAQATSAVESMLSGVITTLKAGESVTLTGFGSFTVVDRASRMARNPRTGESIQIPASRAPKFKAGKGLKEAIS